MRATTILSALKKLNDPPHEVGTYYVSYRYSFRKAETFIAYLAQVAAAYDAHQKTLADARASIARMRAEQARAAGDYAAEVADRMLEERR